MQEYALQSKHAISIARGDRSLNKQQQSLLSSNFTLVKFCLEINIGLYNGEKNLIFPSHHKNYFKLEHLLQHFIYISVGPTDLWMNFFANSYKK